MKRRPVLWQLALALLLALTVAACSGNASAPHFSPTVVTYTYWTSTGSLNTARATQTATLLKDGEVLVVGGGGPEPLASAELYDPSTGTWTTTGSLADTRVGQTATLLENGDVLVAGGDEMLPDGESTELASAQLYNPAMRTWSATGAMNVARENQTATLLATGQVLVAGGGFNGDPFGTLNSAELYNPSTGTWTLTGSMSTAREYDTATLLANGKVLVAGGEDNSNTPLASAEVYDPATGIWTATGATHLPRYGYTATLLSNGLVLAVAGVDTGGQVELYNPVTGTWTFTASLGIDLSDQTATRLPDGQVLVAGGFCDDFGSSAGAYVPLTELFTLTTIPPIHR